MKIAACSSITSARLARLTSMPISSRSTAAVESRSSHSAMASSVRLEKLRAKARVDCARGPSLPSMLMGRPSTKPTTLRSPAIASSRAASGLERLALDGLDAGRKPAVGIGHGNADGLGAEIEADQRAAFGPVRGGFDQQDKTACAHITRALRVDPDMNTAIRRAVVCGCKAEDRGHGSCSFA